MLSDCLNLGCFVGLFRTSSNLQLDQNVCTSVLHLAPLYHVLEVAVTVLADVYASDAASELYDLYATRFSSRAPVQNSYLPCRNYTVWTLYSMDLEGTT